MPVSFEKLEIGQSYERTTLAVIWGYRKFNAIAKGIVTPAKTRFIILFVTQEKQSSATPYVDSLSGEFLHMEGEAAHRLDLRLVQAKSSGDEIHLFHRVVHHSPFVYYGRIGLVAHSLQTDRPSHFTFHLDSSVWKIVNYSRIPDIHRAARVSEQPAKLSSLARTASATTGKNTRREIWGYNELLLAFNLYCKTPFGRLHKRNPDVIALAALIGRSVNAVSWKLVNFARLDPALRKRGIKGASHGGKGEIEVWNLFHENWEKLALESENLLADLKGEDIEKKYAGEAGIDSVIGNAIPTEGFDRKALVQVRVKQAFFRKTILATYSSTCCITGLRVPELLVASHIIPWAKAAKHRLDPTNGLCLNALHDRAFDRHLLTVTPDHEILISTRVKSEFLNLEEQNFLTRFHGRKISLPKKFRPASEFLNDHHSIFSSLESAGTS